jgi:hypothetical protein
MSSSVFSYLAMPLFTSKRRNETVLRIKLATDERTEYFVVALLPEALHQTQIHNCHTTCTIFSYDFHLHKSEIE